MSEIEPEPDDAQDLVPYRFTDRVWPYSWMGQFLEALSQVPVITVACATVNRNRSWVYACRDRFPDFKSGWDEALERGPDMIEATIIRYGTTGIPIRETRTKTVNGEVVETVVTESVALSPALGKLVLGRFKSEYRDSVRHEHTGDGGGAIRVDHDIALGEVNRWPTEERAMELARIALEMGITPRSSPLLIEATPVEEEDDGDADSPA